VALFEKTRRTDGERAEKALRDDVEFGEKLRLVLLAFDAPQRRAALTGFLWGEGFFHRPLFVGVTDRRLVLRRTSRWSTKRSSPWLAVRLDDVSVRAFERGTHWLRADISLGRPGTRRLLFQRTWREEAEELLTLLSADPR
jgi:hypothetical protein